MEELYILKNISDNLQLWSCIKNTFKSISIKLLNSQNLSQFRGVILIKLEFKCHVLLPLLCCGSPSLSLVSLIPLAAV